MSKPLFKPCPDKSHLSNILSLVVLLDERDSSAFAGDFFRDLSSYIDVVTLEEAWPDKHYDAIFIIQSCNFLISKTFEKKLSARAATAQVSVIIYTAELALCIIKGFVPIKLMQGTIGIQEPVESLLNAVFFQDFSGVALADYEGALRYASFAYFYACPINVKQTQVKEAQQILREISLISGLDSLCLFYNAVEFAIDDYSILGGLPYSYSDVRSDNVFFIVSVNVKNTKLPDDSRLGFLAIERS